MGSCCCCLCRETSRMEIASLNEKTVSNQADQGARNNVVDFDFLFEFSPERRTEPELRFEQDQVGQQGGEQQTEGSGGRSRRAEVRPYPHPEMRSTNTAGEVPSECEGVPCSQKVEIPVLGRHDPGAGEGKRRSERGAHQVCRLVPDA